VCNGNINIGLGLKLYQLKILCENYKKLDVLEIQRTNFKIGLKVPSKTKKELEMGLKVDLKSRTRQHWSIHVWN
jgi:hypothetical protein